MLRAQALYKARFDQFGETRRNIAQLRIRQRIDLKKRTPAVGEAHEQTLRVFGKQVECLQKLPLGLDQNGIIKLPDKIQHIAVVVEVVFRGKVGGFQGC